MNMNRRVIQFPPNAKNVCNSIEKFNIKSWKLKEMKMSNHKIQTNLISSQIKIRFSHDSVPFFDDVD